MSPAGFGQRLYTLLCPLPAQPACAARHPAGAPGCSVGSVALSERGAASAAAAGSVSCREVAQRNCPVLCVAPAPAGCEVLVAVAQHDSPEFRRQSREYGQVSPGERPAHRDAAPACPLAPAKPG